MRTMLGHWMVSRRVSLTPSMPPTWEKLWVPVECRDSPLSVRGTKSLRATWKSCAVSRLCPLAFTSCPVLCTLSTRVEVERLTRSWYASQRCFSDGLNDLVSLSLRCSLRGDEGRLLVVNGLILVPESSRENETWERCFRRGVEIGSRSTSGQICLMWAQLTARSTTPTRSPAW